ncbi:MAG: alpha/beta fold hydrolase, partial [Candidatus Viridilinea halotolerans]
MLRRSSLLPSLLSGAVGLVGGALGAAWYISHRVTPEPRRTFIDAYTFTPWELGVPFEPISIMSSNGVTLRGWWLPQTDPKGILIGCHGHSGSKDDMLGIGSNVWRAGYSVLLFDFRGRGESDPWPQTLVSREVDDLHAAVAFAAARLPQVPIGVIGFSMGAAVAIITAAQKPRLR